MKPWLAIMAADGASRVAKYLDFGTRAEADAHVASFIARFPNAFAAANPGGGPLDWRVNGKALVLDPVTPPAPPTKEEKVDRAIDADAAVAPLVKLLAEERGITEQEFRDKLYQRAPALAAAVR